MNNSVSEKSVQHGLERKNTGNLQTLWLEIPAFCNLFCNYCYANGGGSVSMEEMESWLTRANYMSILDQAKSLGVNSIGIPGAGEPFLPGKGVSNRTITMQILHRCAELDIFVTVFTTGEFIDEKLADELLSLPCEIMLKGNSLNPRKQDAFISDPSRGSECVRTGYGAIRNKVLKMLVAKGFNKPDYGRNSRLALVTSIMADSHLSNLDELPGLLEYCRKRNIIFDCDTILKRGRGCNSELSVEDEAVKNVLLKLQKIDQGFNNSWEISQSYAGTTCDRCFHHLYINHRGDIRPCIGAESISLGNAKSTSLEEAWNSPVMKIFRNRKFGGTCGNNCKNFAEGKCNSCVGRRSPANTTAEDILRQGEIPTFGCWNQHPIH